VNRNKLNCIVKGELREMRECDAIVNATDRNAMPKLFISKQSILTSYCRTMGLAVVVSCCSLALCLSPLNAKERPQPKSPLWQIKGIVAALENRDRDQFPLDLHESAYVQIILLDQPNLKNYRQIGKIIVDTAIADLRQANTYSSRISRAGKVLEKFAPNDPEIIKFLHDLANTSKSDDVRCIAVQSLSAIDQADRQASQTLTALARNTQESLGVRACAAESFERLGKRDSAIMLLLQNLLQNPQNHATLRVKAAIALIQLGDNDPNLPEILLKLAQDRHNKPVSRSIALEALGSLKNADPQVINALLQFIQTEKADDWLRYQAAESVSKLVTADHPAVSRLLIGILNNPDEYWWLRESAIDTLVKWSVTHPKYQKLMLDTLANQQSEARIREDIINALIRNDFTEANPLLIPVLSSLAQNSQEDSKIRDGAVAKLGQLGKNNRAIREMIIAIAQNRWGDVNRRERAIAALANWAKRHPPDRQILLDILNNTKEDFQIRLFIAEKIGTFQPLNLNQLFLFANATHDVRPGTRKSRFNAYFYGQGTEDIQLLMQWLGRPQILPNLVNMTDTDRRKTLQICLTVWPDSQGFEKSRAELVKAITLIVSSSRWTSNDLPLLEQHHQNLNRAYFSEATIIKGVIESLYQINL
jgi:HEAT repeats